MTTVRIFSPEKLYYAKIAGITAAFILLFLNTHQHFSNPVIVIGLLIAGYYLGKITCSVHSKAAGIGVTLLVFVLMNMIHSFIDGISFTGQPLLYWLGAVGGHEAIRQPTLYIILWAMLQPVIPNNYAKITICFFAVTGAWVLGMWLGKISGNSISHIDYIAGWMGYTIFLFVGDIVHHLVDQYQTIRKKTGT